MIITLCRHEVGRPVAIIPFDENHNLPTLIVDYQDRKQLAIDLILKARPLP
jgi:hypothetical protein